jgi:hypothetical protein
MAIRQHEESKIRLRSVTGPAERPEYIYYHSIKWEISEQAANHWIIQHIKRATIHDEPLKVASRSEYWEVWDVLASQVSGLSYVFPFKRERNLEEYYLAQGPMRYHVAKKIGQSILQARQAKQPQAARWISTRTCCAARNWRVCIAKPTVSMTYSRTQQKTTPASRDGASSWARSIASQRRTLLSLAGFLETA